MTDTITASHGRWREILLAVGINSKFLTGKAGPCPMCGGTDRWTFTDRCGDGDYICRGCGAGKGLQLVARFTGRDFATVAREVDQIIGNLPPPMVLRRRAVKENISREELNFIWSHAKTIGQNNDPVSRYFHLRGFDIDGPSFACVLRYAPSALHAYTRTTYPALIAKFCDALGKPKHLQITYLTEGGAKARVERPRLYTHGELPKGGAIRLGPEAETMGVAEGIETALSAAIIHGMPVWATTSTSMLEKWKPPVIAKRIIIFGDSDQSAAGQRAAYALMERLVREAKEDKVERNVDVMLPPRKGEDWNDVLIAERKSGLPFEFLAVFDPEKERASFARAVAETEAREQRQ